MKSMRQGPGFPEHALPKASLRSVPQASEVPGLPPREVWERHGTSVYSLACALLGDEAAAMQAVSRAMVDLARDGEGVPEKDARRSLARHVYLRSQELVDDTFRSMDLPPAMVWLGELAPLQRACLALCVFGGHTHHQAADLLGVAPLTVAELLNAGLRDLSGLALVENAS